MANIDLHTHTIYSDGSLSPNQIVVNAKKVGLKALAVTDHDNTKATEVAILKGKELGVEVIPAIELTAYADERNDYHILGYFINYRDRTLQKNLEVWQKEREEKAKKVIAALNKLGFKINFKQIRDVAKGAIASPHLAYLVINNKENEEKLVEEFGEIPDTGAFIRAYLAYGGKAFEKRQAASPKEAIELIHHAGGVAVLAHPCWSLAEKIGKKLVFADSPVKELVGYGLDGLEVYGQRGNEEDTKKCVDHYLELAKKYNLLVTGGSDYHGFGSAGKELGYENFYLKVPESILKDLKKKAESLKSEVRS